MAKGENIFKRKDGRWEARYIKGYEASGKIKYGYCYGKTYKEAKDKVTKTRALVANGKPVPADASKQKFSLFCDEWIRANKGNWKESTCIKYETTIEKHIKPRMGDCFPMDLDDGMIETFTNSLLSGDNLAPKTVKDILMVLHSVLRFASKRCSQTFPQVEISYPKEVKSQMRVLTREEQDHFIRYLLCDMDSCKFGVLLALLTGMRIGELCALRWENVSMEDRTIRISSTMQRLKNTDTERQAKTKVVIGTPKSSNSVRVIPMSNNAAKLCEKMRPADDTCFLLTGQPDFMEPRTLQYRMKRYTSACSLEGVHFHTLRHTFATRCVEVGFEIKSLSEILGHASTTITLERYVHASMELKRDNMNKLASIGL